MAEKNWSSELSAYIDEELPAEEARALEARLAEDPALRALEQRLRRAVVAVEALPQPAPSPSRLRAKVLAAVREAPAPSWSERLSTWLTGPRLVPVGFALAAAATAVVVWPRRHHGEELGEEEQLLVSEHLDLMEDLDLVGMGSAEDLEVIASLHELEGLR